MGKWLNGARLVREGIDKAGAMLTNEQAIKVAVIYPPWDKDIEITEEMIGAGQNRFTRNGKLYYTETPHTTIETWEPGVETASIWIVINEVNAGTIDDPIPAELGLYYKEGLYYIEDGKIYLCIRQDTEDGTRLYNMPHELVGNYFSEVTE